MDARAILQAMEKIPDHAEPDAPIMRCRCGWRGPFYLMLVPVKYPGTARCPVCMADELTVDT